MFGLVRLVAQPAPAETAADIAWKQLLRLDRNRGGTANETLRKQFGEGSMEWWRWEETTRRQFRELGLQFWSQFPDDERRYEWLEDTIAIAPEYWKDLQQGSNAWAAKACELAVVDQAACGAWNRQYLVLRSEYLLSSRLSNESKGKLLSHEYRGRLWATTNALKRNELVDLDRLAVDLIDLLSHPVFTVPEWRLKALPGWLLTLLEQDPGLQASFLASLKLVPNEVLRQFARAREGVARLRENPFDLQISTMTGGQISVGQLRGKVVLVYIWSNECLSCIEALPKLQKLHEKYQAQGFEIFGVWLKPAAREGLNPEQTEWTKKYIADAVPTALGHLERNGAKWANGILEGKQREEFLEKYGIIGMPVTWLLDQNGRLITTDVFSATKLEREVRKLLGLPPLENDKPAQR